MDIISMKIFKQDPPELDVKVSIKVVIKLSKKMPTAIYLGRDVDRKH